MECEEELEGKRKESGRSWKGREQRVGGVGREEDREGEEELEGVGGGFGREENILWEEKLKGREQRV